MPAIPPHIAVIGGGIAGLATAHALLRRGAGKVCLFEAEKELATHSSGRSAGIWLPTEAIDESPHWTRRSVELLNALFGDESWIRRTGAYKVAPQKSLLQSHLDSALAAGCEARWTSAQELEQAFPWISPGKRAFGIYVPEAGILDTEAIMSRLSQDSLRRGLKLRRGVWVQSLLAGVGPGPRWALRDRTGEGLGRFDWIVDATGAWGSQLFASLGYAREIIPLRRHILRFGGKSTSTDGPIVWAESPEFYLRPGPQPWGSPCDADRVEPGSTNARDDVQDLWRQRAGEVPGGPPMDLWSGTRNHSADGRILKGPVPGAQGLAWLLGLAGRGMTVGLGVADAGAQAILEEG